jgi:hypothetical protein
MVLHGFPIGVSKTAPELGIFNRKDPVFFSSKVFSRALWHFGGEKIEKKLFPKRRWVSKDSPIGVPKNCSRTRDFQ